jgi:LytS/YehU family sensor histidine kinase
LFNALNSIVALVRERRNEDAVGMLVALSDVLRRSIDDADQEIALKEELQFLRPYLEIQRVRFADRLQIEIDVAPELLDARVPSLVLQPIVENAIEHGIAKQAREGRVRVAASRSNGTLDLRVYNDGPPLADRQEHAPGIGLSNVRTRLLHLYGDRFTLSLENRDVGVEASLSLPYREA